METKKYTVLWVDDDPKDELIEEALIQYGIDLNVQTCYSEGIKWLKEHDLECDGVILDVYCKDSPEESPNIESFQNNMREIRWETL